MYSGFHTGCFLWGGGARVSNHNVYQICPQLNEKLQAVIEQNFNVTWHQDIDLKRDKISCIIDLCYAKGVAVPDRESSMESFGTVGSPNFS